MSSTRGSTKGGGGKTKASKSALPSPRQGATVPGFSKAGKVCSFT